MNKQQQSRVKEMKAIVGEQVPEKVCLELLKKFKWDTNQAIENFYTGGHADKYGAYQGTANLNEQNVKALFANYAASSGSKIDGEGIEQFMVDIKVDMEDPVTVGISKLMDAKGMEWTYDNFKKGCGQVGADTIPAWINSIQTIRQRMKKDETFYEQVYEQAFEISQEPGLKNIDSETACALWPLFLQDRCQYLEKWITFIENSKEHTIIKRDEWVMLYSVNKAVKGDFNNFSAIDDGTWPVIFDQFLEYFEANK